MPQGVREHPDHRGGLLREGCPLLPWHRRAILAWRYVRSNKHRSFIGLGASHPPSEDGLSSSRQLAVVQNRLYQFIVVYCSSVQFKEVLVIIWPGLLNILKSHENNIFKFFNDLLEWQHSSVGHQQGDLLYGWIGSYHPIYGTHLTLLAPFCYIVLWITLILNSLSAGNKRINPISYIRALSGCP